MHIINQTFDDWKDVLILKNAKIASMQGEANESPYGLIEDAALRINSGQIEWIGSVTDEAVLDSGGEEVVDLQGRLVTPGLIDCHTHVVFSGDRANEFEMRLNGHSYEAIAQAGGGIVSTVSATRAATLDQLTESALPRVDALIAEGVTTLEIKSGYGLDIDTELNMLRAARAIGEQRNITIRTSFLGAHTTPKEFEGRTSEYLQQVCIPALRAAHAEQLVDAVDGFCEGIAFTPNEIEAVFQVAGELGLPVKLHAEQLSNSGGIQLAVRHRAMSVDHIEYADESDVDALAGSGCVAVLLPGAFYTLRENQHPPVELMRKQNIPIAIATDCNPGSSPLASLLLTMNMACTLFRLTPAEALAGVTRNAAKALRLDDRGEIAVGKRADLAIWNVKHPAELSYRIGFNSLHQRMINGEWS